MQKLKNDQLAARNRLLETRAAEIQNLFGETVAENKKLLFLIKEQRDQNTELENQQKK